MKEQAKWLIETIESFDTIIIFRHILADADALGSQFGLKTWIQDRFPQKKVFAVGNDAGACASYYPAIDEVSEDLFAGALAIILDTSTAARIDDDRWKLAKKIIRIDHHILTEHYCEEEIIDEKAAATCEILALLLKENNEILSSTCANYLYSGLIADTINFTISSTTSRTLKAAAYLLDFDIDIVARNMEHFGTHYRDFEYESWLRTCLNFEDGVGHAIVDQSDFERFHMSFKEAKEKVFVFSGIYEVEIWALFTQMDTTSTGEPLYTASLRSRTIQIDDIANSYGGGGHRCACGIKHLTRVQISDLLMDLRERLKNRQA